MAENVCARTLVLGRRLLNSTEADAWLRDFDSAQQRGCMMLSVWPYVFLVYWQLFVVQLVCGKKEGAAWMIVTAAWRSLSQNSGKTLKAVVTQLLLMMAGWNMLRCDGCDGLFSSWNSGSCRKNRDRLGVARHHRNRRQVAAWSSSSSADHVWVPNPIVGCCALQLCSEPTIK